MKESRRGFISKSTHFLVGLSLGWPFRRIFAQENVNLKNKFLIGNYAPVLDEASVTELKVMGEIPKGLYGLFVRNGPNPIHPPTPYHWFDGDGMLHGIYFKNGKAAYLNRFVQTEGYLKEKAAGRSLYGGLIAGPPIKDSANTSVIFHHGKMLAAWEGAPPHILDPSNLKTLGVDDFGGKLNHPFTAHPKIDPETGELIFFGYYTEASEAPYIRYGVTDSAGNITHHTPIDIPRGVMMHDFAITKNYSIFMDLPLVSTTRGFNWQPEKGARIGILARKSDGTKIRWFQISPGWVYHTLNAFEEGDTVTLLGCRRKTWPKSASLLHRWVFDLKKGTVVETALDDSLSEFPTINPAMVGRSFQYGYMVGLSDEAGDSIHRYDLKAARTDKHSFGKNRYGDEAIFVSKDHATDENDGYLLNFVYDKASDTSEVLIIDAKNFTTAPIARVILPRRVPYGLHAAWLPGNEQKV